MSRRPRRPAPSHLAATVTAAALLLTACGGGGEGATTASTTAASASPSASAPSGKDFLLAVNDRLLAQTGSVTTTTTPTSTQTVTRTGDDVLVTEQGQYSSATVVAVGGEVWANGDEGFWILSTPSGDPTEGADLAGRWVLITGTQTSAQYVRGPATVFSHPDDTTKTGSDTVDGTPVDVWSDPVAASTIYLSTGDEPLPVRIEQPDSTVVTFSGYGAAVPITPPAAAQVVDGRDRVR